MLFHRFTQRPGWFDITNVADGIYQVTEPYYRDDYRGNIYVVKGSRRDLVVDAGLGLGSLRSFLAPVAESPLLVCTHAHYDHIGGAFEFSERAVHPAEADVVARPTAQNTYADRFFSTAQFYALPWNGFRAWEWVAAPAPATKLVDEGDRIDLGDRSFTVLSTPGHSWGSICLWEEATGVMFSGDTVCKGERFDFLPCSDIPAYVRTMKRLRDYPVRVAYPGHGPILEGKEYRAVIDEYLRTRRCGSPNPLPEAGSRAVA